MKSRRRWTFLPLLIAFSSLCHAQESKPEDVKKYLDEQNYVFIAQRVSPMARPTRDISGQGYEVTISKTQVESFLPYFGKAYVAPANPAEGGIKFTSRKFDYNRDQTKKGWRVLIKPKDASDVQQLQLDVFDNGRATLQVISTNRQNISFDGYIQEGKPAEKKAF